MPWQESSVVEERLRFVVLAHRRERPMAELCAEFGISRQTGYTWLERYARGGVKQVVERSRRPLHSPRRTSSEVEEAVVALRKRWPDWGAPKLAVKLWEQHGVGIDLRAYGAPDPGAASANPGEGSPSSGPEAV